ncbi:DCC1-like thiol-disulfide oxidoreductase family protein [Cohnella hashimotonis]|uniref:DCC1-like thiol-disulfide oxidoreductase family protein n=1 Tax=Cohnella hashimotonis TaxID=2826895 RepID=A0ABT6TK03_9BACL|nr:DCC1-like thiol-disulfide oxidoreductase family protein [Cohnella hashimotonis]MDI4647177.1 DCC1-like thiol-disulfide oxidoreductase family protein [Cohnella hashimotonis]
MRRYVDMGKSGTGARLQAATERSPESGMRDNEADVFVLLVDGDCVMCRGIARFAAKRDRAERLRFAAQDSAAGRELMTRLGLELPSGGSFALVRGTASWTRSAAAIRTLAALDAPWPAAAAALRLVPARLRDAVYDAVAARRHRLARRMGERCPARPDERLRRRLLEGGGWTGEDDIDAAGAMDADAAHSSGLAEAAPATNAAKPFRHAEAAPATNAAELTGHAEAARATNAAELKGGAR